MSVLPESWATVSLSEIGTAITGNTPPTKNPANYGQDVPFVKPPDLNNRPFAITQTFLSKEGAGIGRTLPAHSILVTCIGNLGRVGINRTFVAFNQQINAVVPGDALFPYFLFYAAQSHDFRTQLESKASATTISIVNKGNFERITIPLPPLAEQKRIVAKIEELFSELDAGEESLRRARRQLGVYRQSLLKQAFEGKLTAPWRAQHLDVPEPSGTTLEELVQIQSGNGFPKQYQGEDDGDFPFFKVGDISKNAQAGHRRLGRADNYISDEVLKKIRGKIIPPDATVFAKIGAAVALNRRAITSQPCLIDNNAMALVPCNKVDPDFLYLFMRQVDLGDKTRGGAVPSLRKGDIEEIPILLPLLPEQQEVVRLLDEQFEVIEQNEREIDAALKRSEALRQSILKKAFTGQLVPQDPADEPAAELLSRIREEREESERTKPAAKNRTTKKARQ